MNDDDDGNNHRIENVNNLINLNIINNVWIDK